jgi:hypothetical protein
MPARTAAYDRERPVRLKPGLLSGDIWIKNSTFISNNLAQSRTGREEPQNLWNFAALREPIRPYLQGIAPNR